MFISRLFPSTSLTTFRSDERGIAAVEFGMIAPVALIMMLGLIECGRGLVMARRFNLVTSVASDLVARNKTMSDADLDGVATAVQLIWQPYEPAPLNFTIMQVRAAGPAATKKAPGTTYIDWGRQYVWSSNRYTGTTLAINCPNKVNTAVTTGNSAIVVESNFTFAPLFTGGGYASNIMPASSWNWTASSVHATRTGCVAYPTATCNLSCE